MIHRISPDALEPDVLERIVYPSVGHTYYWSDLWDPDFYVDLARAGFITTSFAHPELGTILLPEIQSAYAILDWEDLHVSRKLRALLRSGRVERDGVELRIATRRDRVIERLLAYHRERTWLTPPYLALLDRLPTDPRTGFALHAVELWSRDAGRVIAGELGYSIGSSYTSLSGFCDRAERRWRHAGTLQLVLLARRLERCGYAFWNLGHPQLAYKRALGARPLPRRRFLDRWTRTRDAAPHRWLGDPADAEGPSRPVVPPGLTAEPGRT